VVALYFTSLLSMCMCVLVLVFLFHVTAPPAVSWFFNFKCVAQLQNPPTTQILYNGSNLQGNCNSKERKHVFISLKLFGVVVFVNRRYCSLLYPLSQHQFSRCILLHSVSCLGLVCARFNTSNHNFIRFFRGLRITYLCGGTSPTPG
jgi:hypothetical protein